MNSLIRYLADIRYISHLSSAIIWPAYELSHKIHAGAPAAVEIIRRFAPQTEEQI